MWPDINKPVENPKLTTLFAERAKAEAAERASWNEQIAKEIALNASLLAVVQMNPVPDENGSQGGEIRLKEKTTVSFPMLSSADGKIYLPVFTDWKELRKWPLYADQHVRTMILSFDDIVGISAGKSGAAVNPFSDDFRISPENIARMKQMKDIRNNGAADIKVEKGTAIQLGVPADYPTEMVEAIREYAKGNSSIEAVWLKLMVQNNQQSYLLVVDSTGDRKTVWKGIADAAMPHRRNGLFIDFVPLDDSFGKQAATGEPIYRRRHGFPDGLFG